MTYPETVTKSHACLSNCLNLACFKILEPYGEKIVTKVAQEHHRNEQLHLYRRVCLLVNRVNDAMIRRDCIAGDSITKDPIARK